MLRVAEAHWELWGLMRQLAMIARKSEAPTPREAAQLLSKPLCATGAGGMCVRVAKYRSDLLKFVSTSGSKRERKGRYFVVSIPTLHPRIGEPQMEASSEGPATLNRGPIGPSQTQITTPSALRPARGSIRQLGNRHCCPPSSIIRFLYRAAKSGTNASITFFLFS
jgi:hypothetical protein